VPANVVKTASDEARWKRAKAAAAEQGKAKNYALVMHIYQQMDKAEQLGLFDRPAKPKASGGGPFIGPRGGKWKDPQHKIPWEESGSPAPKKAAAPKAEPTTAERKSDVEQRAHSAPWTISQDAYKYVVGAESPHLMEISGVQRGRMSKRGLREYDAKKNARWEAAGKASRAYDEAVVAAFKAGKFKLDDPKLNRDAKSAVLSARVAASKQAAAQTMDQLTKENQPFVIRDGAVVPTAKPGDRVFQRVMGYATVVKVNKKSMKVKLESGREQTHPHTMFAWLHYNELKKLADTGGSLSAEHGPSEAAEKSMLTPQELQERSKRKKAAKHHARLAEDHRSAGTAGGNQMSQWKQEKAHDEAQEAHEEAAEANRDAITNSSARDDADDASDDANTHPSVEETEKSMSSLSKAKAGGPFIGPKGGKWADAKHTIPYKTDGAAPKAKRKGSHKAHAIYHQREALAAHNAGDTSRAGAHMDAAAAHTQAAKTGGLEHGGRANALTERASSARPQKDIERGNRMAAQHKQKQAEHKAIADRMRDPVKTRELGIASTADTMARNHDDASIMHGHAAKRHASGGPSADSFSSGAYEATNEAHDLDAKPPKRADSGDQATHHHRMQEYHNKQAVHALGAGKEHHQTAVMHALAGRIHGDARDDHTYGGKDADYQTQLANDASRAAGNEAPKPSDPYEPVGNVPTGWEHPEGQQGTTGAMASTLEAAKQGINKDDVSGVMGQAMMAYGWVKEQRGKFVTTDRGLKVLADTAAKKSLNVIDEMNKLMKAAQPGAIIGRTADGKEVYSHDADPLQKKKSGGAVKGADPKAAKPGAAQPGQKPAAGGQAKPGEEEENGEGTHEHHRDRALAHLQAAQAHAGAASSAKKVEQAKDHKEAVGGAREASEAAMADPEVKKSEGEGTRGGKIIGHTGSGKPIYQTHSGDHPSYTHSKTGKKLGAMQGKTELGHEGKAPKLIEHGGKHHVKAAHNSDTGSVSYHEYDSGKHLIDPEKGTAIHAQKLDDKYARGAGAGGDLFQTHGMYEDLPKEINDPTHGKLSIRGHNSDTGTAVYHQADKNPGWGKSMSEDRMLYKNNLSVNLDSEQAVLDHLERGAVVGGQSAGIREDRRHSLLGMREERMDKGIDFTGGTIHQGEYDAQGSRGGDMRETVARAQCRAEMIELDDAGNAGNGGLDEWFRDAWSSLLPDQAAASNPGAMRPKATGWQKGQNPDDQPIGVINDDDPYTRAVLKGGQAGEHQSAIRMAYQGNGRDNKR